MKNMIKNINFKLALVRLFELLKLILIAYTISYCITLSQQYTDEYLSNNISYGKYINSFVGLRFLQKVFCFVIAYAIKQLLKKYGQKLTKMVNNLKLPFLQLINRYISSEIENKQIIQQSSRQMQFDSSDIIQQVEIKKNKEFNYPLIMLQIWIGFSYFMSLLLFHIIQQAKTKSQISQIITKKQFNILVVYICIHLISIIPYRKNKGIIYNIGNFIINVIIIYELVNIRTSVIQQGDILKFHSSMYLLVTQTKLNNLYYGMWFNIGFFATLFFIKYYKKDIKTLDILMVMTKYTALSFFIYGLYTYETFDTIKLLFTVHSTLGPLFKAFICRFIYNLLLAYLIVNYSPLFFFAIYLSRGILINATSNLFPQQLTQLQVLDPLLSIQQKQPTYNQHILIFILAILALQISLTKHVKQKKEERTNLNEAETEMSMEIQKDSKDKEN